MSAASDARDGDCALAKDASSSASLCPRTGLDGAGCEQRVALRRALAASQPSPEGHSAALVALALFSLRSQSCRVWHCG